MDDEKGIELRFTPSKSGSTHGTLLAKKGSEQLHADKLDVAKEKARTQFLGALVEKYPALGEPANQQDLKQELLKIVDDQLNHAGSESADPDASHDHTPLHLGEKALKETDEKLIRLGREFLVRPNLVDCIIDHTCQLGVAGEHELILTIYLIGTSRLLPKPLAGLVMGASSAGKSYTISKVASLFPKEAVLQAHRLTPRALEHMPDGSLKNRFVVTGERSRLQDDAAVEGTRARREMLGDGRLTLAITVKDDSGGWETIHIQQEGPIAYIESTTLEFRDIFDEDRTRMLLLSADEGHQQTAAVVRRLAADAACPPDDDSSDSICALHHTAQRLLRPCTVIVPFAGQLTECLPGDRLEVRRTFGHLLSLIQSVALLHQFQRDRDNEGRIIASPYDYEVVRCHLTGALARSLGCSLTPGARALLEKAKGMGSQFKVLGLAAQTHLSENTVRGRIRELERSGQVKKVQASQGRQAAVYEVVEEPPPMHGLCLPALTGPVDTREVSLSGDLVADKA